MRPAPGRAPPQPGRERTPVVLVHAGLDRVIPVAEGERLAAARADLELHVIAGAEHAGCLAVDPIALEQHLQALLAAVADRR